MGYRPDARARGWPGAAVFDLMLPLMFLQGFLGLLDLLGPVLSQADSLGNVITFAEINPMHQKARLGRMLNQNVVGLAPALAAVARTWSSFATSGPRCWQTTSLSLPIGLFPSFGRSGWSVSLEPPEQSYFLLRPLSSPPACWFASGRGWKPGCQPGLVPLGAPTGDQSPATPPVHHDARLRP